MKREAILMFGPAGTGKSYNLLSIARALPNRKFFIIDTDDDWEVSTDNEDLPNIAIITSYNWMDCIEGIKKVKKLAKAGDWIGLDMLDTTWDYVQSHFVKEVFHEEMDEYYLEVRKAMKEGAKSLETFDGWCDWRVINQMYSKFWQDILETPCHIFAMAKGTALAQKNEDRLTAMLSAPHGVKPDGQKRTAHRFHSIFITGVQNNPVVPGELQWNITTYRERWKRKYLSRYVLGDFFLAYGIAHAGWGRDGSAVF